jgi:MFS family permease
MTVEVEGTADTSRVPSARVARQVAIASFVGTAMEWYDFFLFTTAAALVFNVQYFVSDNALTATLASFATLAIGFVARPVGGVICGLLGDRVGRKKILMVTIIGIGVVTGLIGVLPTYASIGIAAPVILIVLRIVQGLAVGGEWGGAVTIAIENAPPEQRARFASVPQLGSPVGTLLSSGAFFAVSHFLTESSFDAWGWRLPFLAAIPLLAISLYLRRKLSESPEFEALMESGETESAPIRTVLRTSWRQILIGASVMFLGAGGFYLVTTFVVNYGKRVLDLSAEQLLLATVVAAAVEVPVIWYGGRLGGRFGSSRVVIGGAIASILLAFPIFGLIGTAHEVWLVLAMTAGVAAVSFPYAVSGAVLTSLFPLKLRYSGVSLAFNASGVVSGCVPLLAAYILTFTGDHLWPSAVLLMVIGAIALVGGLLAPRYSIREAGVRL